MSRIDELIAELCPEGVIFQQLGTLGRRNKGTAITAAKMKVLAQTLGPIRIFAGGQTIADVSEDAIPDKNIVREPSIIVKSRGHIGFTYYEKPFTHKNELWSYTIDRPDVDQKFVFYYLLTRVTRLQELARATSVKLPQLGVKDTDDLPIPIPPLEVQRAVVEILDTFSKLEARKQQYEHYRYELLAPSNNHPIVALEDVADFFNAKAHEKLVHPEGTVALMTARFISRGEANRYVFPEDVLTPAFIGDVALVMSDLPNGRALARTFFVDENDKYAANQRVCLLRSKDTEELDPKYFHYIMNRNKQLLAYDSGFDQTHLKKDYILKVRFELPPIEEQRRIVSVLDKFDALVNDLSVGLPAELAARRQQYEYYRDKLLTFKELEVAS